MACIHKRSLAAGGPADLPGERSLARPATDEATVPARDDALQSWVFDAIMEKIRANVYITRPETGEILFVNSAMQEAFGGAETLVGKTCWQTLQRGMDGPCPFCPVPKLMAGGDKSPACVWEEHNTVNDRVYENHDSLLQWIDGTTVHFQYSLDVTETKRLQRAASIDELTHTYNRRAGREKLGQSIAQCRQAGRTFFLCMYDINLLKEVNDLYGHTEGDFLIAAAARAVKAQMTPPDYLFRLSGDEFIAVFFTDDGQQVQTRIERALLQLSDTRRQLDKPYTMGFCYGIIAVYPQDALEMKEILRLVDQKMYEQKRAYHIRRAQNLAESGAGREPGPLSFDYDKERLYDALVQSTDDYLYVCNMKTGVFRYSAAMVREFDLPGEVIANAAAVWGSHVHPHDKASFLESNQEITDGRTDSHLVEYRARNRRGEWVWMRCRGHLERDEDGEPVLFAGFITNLGKRGKIDLLTGLYNKFEFEQVITAHLQERPADPLQVAVLDLDDFGRINDLYDRDFGDAVIRVTGQRICAILPDGAQLFRLDGDEFGMIYRDSDTGPLEQFFEDMQRTFGRQQEYDGQKYFCTLSAGCAGYPADSDNYLQLFKYASYALEYAKQGGAGNVAHFSAEIFGHKSQALRLSEALRDSVENGFSGFSLAFQPQVEADTGKLTGAEALARWQHPDLGPVSPAEFIPLLEESGLIHPVGRWIFERAVQAYRHWAQKVPSFSMSVNLSRLQLTQPSFIDYMQQVLQESGADPRQIVVELTESYIAANIDEDRAVLDRIRALGMRIAIDDFGTGYSSLGILKRRPGQLVKIDRTFVQDILHSSFDTTFIRFIVALCHDGGMQVLLEGVETWEEYRAVKDMGLDYIQGFLFGRPVDGDVFSALPEQLPAQGRQ